jgi:hypothetical protein
MTPLKTTIDQLASRFVREDIAALSKREGERWARASGCRSLSTSGS